MPDEDVIQRPQGVRIDGEQLKRQLALRGLTGRQLAKAAGVTEITVYRGCGGSRLAPSTLRKLVEALSAIPPMEGAELLVAGATGELDG